MQKCGLNAHDFGLYLDALLNASHEHRIYAQILDLEHIPVSGTECVVIDGQVDLDTTVDISLTPSRRLTATLWDPDHTLESDTNNAASAIVFANRLIRVYFGTYVPALGKTVKCPVFTGPVRGFVRDANTVQITAVGKENLALGNTWQTQRIPRGTQKVAAIRSILANRAGETFFSLPTSKATLPDALSLVPMSQPWHAAHIVGAGMGMRLGYDSLGRCTLRALPTKPLLTVADHDRGVQGTPGYIPSVAINPLQIGLDLTGDWYNGVWVLGATPKGSKTQLSATRMLPEWNLMSPEALARNGVPYYRINKIENSSLKTQAEVDTYAEQQMVDLEKQTITVTVDVKPMPFFDDDDMIRVETKAAAFNMRLSTWSLPLAPGNPMTLGYTMQVSAIRPHVRPKAA